MTFLFLAIVALTEAGATPTPTVSQPPAADDACTWLPTDALRVTVSGHGATAETVLSNTVSRGWTRLADCLREQAKRASPSAPEYDCVPPHGPFVVAVIHGRVVAYRINTAYGSGKVTIELPDAIAHWRATCRTPYAGAGTTTEGDRP